MITRYIRNIIFASLAVLATASCKDDENEVLPPMDGTLVIEGVEAYVNARTSTREITLKPTGVTHPDGKGIGYCWKVTPGMKSYDTTRFENGLNMNNEASDGTFKYTLKDSVATYTIYCYAFADGYSSKSASAYSTVVRGGVQLSPEDPQVSITNTNILENGEPLAGTDYYYVTDGERDWIASNLYEEGGIAYLNYEALSDVLGRFYSYDEAKAICQSLPANGGNAWRLPTDEDWVNVVKSVTKDATGDFTANVHEDIYWDIKKNGKPSLSSRLIANAEFNGTIMWEYWPAIGAITNTSGLAIIPIGYANLGVTPEISSKTAYPNALFEGEFELAVFWTADEVEGNSEMAYYRYINNQDPFFMSGKGYKETFGASVRCVRNSN